MLRSRQPPYNPPILPNNEQFPLKNIPKHNRQVNKETHHTNNQQDTAENPEKGRLQLDAELRDGDPEDAHGEDGAAPRRVPLELPAGGAVEDRHEG